jgi:hypothetical protein
MRMAGMDLFTLLGSFCCSSTPIRTLISDPDCFQATLLVLAYLFVKSLFNLWHLRYTGRFTTGAVWVLDTSQVVLTIQIWSVLLWWCVD